MDVKNFVKYLGVRLGNIRHPQDDQGWGLTMEQAFAPALQEAFRRARVVSTLQLSMNERAFMLTSWILPVVAWVSKAYYAPVSVVRQLKLVYHVTMGTNSWGITLPILSRPRTQGGLALPEPELVLMHQAAAPFVSLLGDPHKFPDKAVETFYAWATAIGFTPSKDNLPYIQLGMVRTADLTFLGWSAKAHSNIQRVAPQVAPPANRDRLPLWHSVYFRNEFRCSYYNTKLIRQGVLTWGQFQSLEDARLFNALPRTWKGVYSHGGRLLNKVMSQGGFDTPAVHTQNWTRAWLLQFYASQPGVRDPQTPEVWEQLAQAQLPPRAQDFARKALWHKLTVHARVYKTCKSTVSCAGRLCYRHRPPHRTRDGEMPSGPRNGGKQWSPAPASGSAFPSSSTHRLCCLLCTPPGISPAEEEVRRAPLCLRLTTFQHTATLELPLRGPTGCSDLPSRRSRLHLM